MKGCYWIATILLLVLLTLLLAGVASAQGPTICDVEAVNIGNTSTTITWTTSELANSTVNYGNTTALGLMVSDSANVTDQSITLTGLTPATLYYYEVSSTNAGGNTTVDNNYGNYYTFTTFSQSLELHGWAWNTFSGQLGNSTLEGYVAMVERAHAPGSYSLHVVGNLTLCLAGASGNETIELDMYGSRSSSLFYLRQEVTGQSASFRGTWIDAGNDTYYICATGRVALPNPDGDVFKTSNINFITLRTPDVEIPSYDSSGSFVDNLEIIIRTLAKIYDVLLDSLMGSSFVDIIASILSALAAMVGTLRGLGTPYVP